MDHNHNHNDSSPDQIAIDHMDMDQVDPETGASGLGLPFSSSLQCADSTHAHEVLLLNHGDSSDQMDPFVFSQSIDNEMTDSSRAVVNPFDDAMDLIPDDLDLNGVYLQISEENTEPLVLAPRIVPGLILYEPLGLIICESCKVGLSPTYESVKLHLEHLHGKSLNDDTHESFILEFYQKFYRSEETLTTSTAQIKVNPISHLSHIKGVICSLCDHVCMASSTQAAMKTHVEESHKYANWNSILALLEPVTMQSFFQHAEPFAVYPESEIGIKPLTISMIDKYDPSALPTTFPVLEFPRDIRFPASPPLHAPNSAEITTEAEWPFFDSAPLTGTWFPSTPTKNHSIFCSEPTADDLDILNFDSNLGDGSKKPLDSTIAFTLFEANLFAFKPLGIFFLN